MAALLPREPEPASSIPPGVWVAIGVSVFIIVVAFVCMVLLLMRATQSHRKLLADLEQRGIRLGQQVEHIGGDGVSRPRAVLRRNVLLPYNNNAAWGTLPSRDSLGRSQSSIAKVQSSSTTNTAPKPQSKRGWSFTKRSKRQPKHIVLEKVRTGHLSAIIESPIPRRNTSASNLQDIQECTTPVDSLPPRLKLGFQESPISTLCAPRISSTPNSAPDLTAQLRPPVPYAIDTVSSSGTVVRSPKRMVRSNSVPSVSGSYLYDFHVNGTRGLRNGSVTNRYSGSAPGDPVPPLPLKLRRDRSVSNMEYSPSRRSVSSYESATSSILITGSPSAHRSPHAKLKQSPGHELHKSLVIKGSRPLIQSLHKSSQSVPLHFRENSIRSNVARLSMQDMHTHSRHGSGDSMKSDPPKTDAQQQSIHNRSDNSLTGNTPRRQSRSQVTLEGSPTERVRSSVPVDGHEPPTHQLSRASTNASSSSSNGNPFQWDPSPMQSGKPAVPRRSPERKKAHRRQNCIRLSVGPTNAAAGGHSSTMSGIEEEPSNSSHRKQPSKEPEMIYLDTRPLPRPPSAGVFEPELRFDPTKIRAALSTGSPTLSLNKYNRDSAEGSPRRHSEISTGSGFSIPTFPSPGSSQPATSQSTFALPPASETSELPDAGFFKLPADDAVTGHIRDKENRRVVSCYQGVFDISPPNASPVEAPSNPRTPRSPKTDRPKSSMPSLLQTPPTIAKSATAGAEVDEPNSSPPVLPEKSPYRASAPSPERANGRRSGGLIGPRAEPAKDLRKTVSELRRMNSDADDEHRTSRRYRMLGRESTMVALDADEEPQLELSPKKKRHKRNKSGSKGSIKQSQSLIIPASSFRLVTNLEDIDHGDEGPRDFSQSSTSLPILSSDSGALGLGIAFDKPETSKENNTTPGKKTPQNRSSKTQSKTKSQITDSSYTSLTDLMLASSSDIFDRREVPGRPTSMATQSQAEWGVVLGGAPSSTAPKSIAEITSTPTVKIVSPTAPPTGNSSRYSGSVWEDGESFWETPSVQEQREREKRRESRVLSELLPETPVNRSEKKARKMRSTMTDANDSDVENRTPPNATTSAQPSRASQSQKQTKPRKPTISIPSIPSTTSLPASPVHTAPVRPPTPPRSQSQSRSRSQSRSSRRASFHSTRSHRSQSQPSASRYSKSSPAPSLHAVTSSPHTPRSRLGRWIAAGLGNVGASQPPAQPSQPQTKNKDSGNSSSRGTPKDKRASTRGKRGGRKWRGASKGKTSDDADANADGYNNMNVAAAEKEKPHPVPAKRAVKERTSLRVFHGRRSVANQQLQQQQLNQQHTSNPDEAGVTKKTLTPQRGVMSMPRVIVETPSPRASTQSADWDGEERGRAMGRGEKPRGARVTVIGDDSEAEGALF